MKKRVELFSRELDRPTVYRLTPAMAAGVTDRVWSLGIGRANIKLG